MGGKNISSSRRLICPCKIFFCPSYEISYFKLKNVTSSIPEPSAGKRKTFLQAQNLADNFPIKSAQIQIFDKTA